MVIVYTSNTGFTKRYAEMLGEKRDFRFMNLMFEKTSEK